MNFEHFIRARESNPQTAAASRETRLVEVQSMLDSWTRQDDPLGRTLIKLKEAKEEIARLEYKLYQYEVNYGPL